jgi:cellulose synthase/poly-beta-1,6-N-acetylglucosamine synthase-like glycosyltransferase
MLKVSIITVCYNSAETIEDTILSVVSQDYASIEYIIVDGKSSDTTLSIIEKYNSKITKVLSEKDDGIWDAMNKGLKIASGDIVCFLNSDDYYYPNAIKTVVRYFNNNNIDFLFGTTQKYKLMYGYKPWKIRFSFGFYTSHSVGFFINRKKHLKVGFYNKKYISADLDFFYKMIVKFKLKGASTKKEEALGKFQSGGFSSRLNFIDNLKDLNKIRIDNNQNIFYVYFIFFIKIIKNLRKFLKSI